MTTTIKSDRGALGIGLMTAAFLKYGQSWMAFMQENHPRRADELRQNQLFEQAARQVTEEAKQMIVDLEKVYLQANPLPQSGDFMENLQHHRDIEAYVREIVNRELIYRSR